MSTVTEQSAALQNALAAIDRYTRQSVQEQATPGLALAITDRAGLLATRNYGFANLDAQTPVTDDTLFEFGSIGKSFTAIIMLQLAEAGRLDLHAPVTTYLPWFQVRSGFEPITLHHLLTHSAGLGGGTDFSPDQHYEVWALREVEAQQPGVRARYSNVGYKILGLVLEAVTGQPYGRLVKERIYTPLGLENAAPVITSAVRPRLAVGYLEFYNDRPWLPEHGFQPAPWLETDTADGSLAASASDLATYLRMLLNGGVGPHGRILSAEAFALLTTPHVQLGERPYGYGLMVHEVDGRQRIGHGGGMVGYISSMIGDVPSGIGVVVFKNSMQDTSEIADFALRTLVAAVEGTPLPVPEAPQPLDLTPFPGVYGQGPEEVSVQVENDALLLVRQGEQIPLRPLGIPPEPDTFLAEHPDLEHFPVRFQRGSDEQVEALVHGGDWFPAAGYTGPTEFAVPPEWHAYPGHYRSFNPWNPSFRVVLRQGVLWLVYPWGEEVLLRPQDDAFVIDNEPEGPERFIFDTIVDGQAWRVSSPGSETYYRFFTP